MRIVKCACQLSGRKRTKQRKKERETEQTSKGKEDKKKRRAKWETCEWCSSNSWLVTGSRERERETGK